MRDSNKSKMRFQPQPSGAPSSGKSHFLRQLQLAAGVPDAIVSHTKGHADVVGKIQRYKIYTTKMQDHLK